MYQRGRSPPSNRVEVLRAKIPDVGSDTLLTASFINCLCTTSVLKSINLSSKIRASLTRNSSRREKPFIKEVGITCKSSVIINLIVSLTNIPPSLDVSFRQNQLFVISFP
ncbi:hypothetical protein KFK09_029070 [Dendrobium nobile]|uniref:Uncharacterized protein n=1 Tax=Dendrobium nobile TaxID=94219 RepID=A0A8T3A482_DENNO|nr:hypothetical protein KFK09_029070 [Dendrobium nobile]